MACLYEDGKLAEREVYRQESVIGSIFVGSIERVGDVLRPTIRGNAFITGDCTLLFDPDDPFRKGIN
jgi:4-hydroxyproline epimerase